MTRIVAMLNQKGGVGKTTSTVNLGAALALAGRRVCLIDLDPQSHLTYHLGIEPADIEQTVYDLLIDPDCPAADARIAGARPNLDALLAEVDLAGAETELASTPERQSILRRKFALIAGDYDVVFIDCPPSLGLLTLNALTMANEIFVPMQAHFLALQGVGRLLETVGLVCRSVNPSLRVTGILLCMHEQQTTLAREIVADLDGFFEAARNQDVPWRDCRVLRPPIRRNIKLAEAPSFGQTIFDYAPWCPGALDYRKVADHLLEQWFGQKPSHPEAISVSPSRSASPMSASTTSAASATLSVAPDRNPAALTLVTHDAAARDSAADAPEDGSPPMPAKDLADDMESRSIERLRSEVASCCRIDEPQTEIDEPPTESDDPPSADSAEVSEGRSDRLRGEAEERDDCGADSRSANWEISTFRSISAREVAEPAGASSDDRDHDL